MRDLKTKSGLQIQQKLDDCLQIIKLLNIYYVFDSVLKTNLWTHKTKDLNREKIIGRSYEKKLLLSILQISYYLEPYSYNRDEVNVVLGLSNHTTIKRIRTCCRH